MKWFIKIVSSPDLARSAYGQGGDREVRTGVLQVGPIVPGVQNGGYLKDFLAFFLW